MTFIYFSAKIVDKEKRAQHSAVIVDYFQKVPMNCAKYCIYMLLETMTLVISILQMVFLDWFLHHAVSTHGLFTVRWFFQDQLTRKDPLLLVFPRLMSCEMKVYGPGSGVTHFSELCVLGHNGVNEAMFICVFIWLMFTTMLTAISIILMLSVGVIPQFRRYIAAFGLNETGKKNIYKLLKGNGIGTFYNFMLVRKNENMV